MFRYAVVEFCIIILVGKEGLLRKLVQVFLMRKVCVFEGKIFCEVGAGA